MYKSYLHHSQPWENPSSNGEYDHMEFNSLQSTPRHCHQEKNSHTQQVKIYSTNLQSHLSNTHHNRVKFNSLLPTPRHYHQDRELLPQKNKLHHPKLRDSLGNSHYKNTIFNSLPPSPRNCHQYQEPLYQKNKAHSPKLKILSRNSHHKDTRFDSLPPSTRNFHQYGNFDNQTIRKKYIKLRNQSPNYNYNAIESSGLSSSPKNSNQQIAILHQEEVKEYYPEALNPLNQNSTLNNYLPQFSSSELFANEIPQSNSYIEKEPKQIYNTNDTFSKDFSLVKLFKLPFSYQSSMSSRLNYFGSKNPQVPSPFKTHPSILPYPTFKSSTMPNQHLYMLPHSTSKSPQMPPI
jgi:hypothetical protein